MSSSHGRISGFAATHPDDMSLSDIQAVIDQYPKCTQWVSVESKAAKRHKSRFG
jgi:hypothetical protein